LFSFICKINFIAKIILIIKQIINYLISMLINIKFEEGKVKFINTNKLPNRIQIVETDDPDRIIEAIKNMEIRGAPAIGAATALCLALVVLYKKYENKQELIKLLSEYSKKLIDARPTAYNMYSSINKIMYVASKSDEKNIASAILNEALKICEKDIEANLKIAEFGNELINDGDKILTHCNTGALATVGVGTALGIIAKAAETKKIFVYVTETRPKLQGSRLTAWELEKYNIPYKIIPDSAAGYLMKLGEINKVIVGADRILLTGHVINKIGTFTIASIANLYKIPFYVASPVTTIDLENTIQNVKIEYRDPLEILKIKRYWIAPKKANALNLAFDVTDPELIEGIITDYGIINKPVQENIRKFVKHIKSAENPL
jgi:S-methyl-5-thioribose-1-phosphate isomerase